MKLKITHRIVIAGLALLAILAFTPMLAQAQVQQASASFQVRGIANPSSDIPVDGSISVEIPWTYTFSLGPTSAQGNVVSSATLVWTNPVICTPAKGISVTGSFNEVIPLPSGTTSGTTKVDGKSTFNVLASSEAPGEISITCIFEGKVLQAGAIPATTPAPGSVAVKVAYRGLITATVPLTIQQAGPQKQIQYSLDVSNLGNSESTIKFSLLAEPESGWQPIVPADVILTSPNKGGTDNSKSVTFVISTPYKNGWNNKETRFQVNIQPSSTKDSGETGKGPAITVTVLARVRGIYVPGPEPALMMLAAVGTALVVRQLRKD